MTPTHKNGVLTNYFMRFKMETSLNKPLLAGFFFEIRMVEFDMGLDEL